uniref:Transcriptional regulator, PadR family n=1 Tax=uncultured bacterium Contig1578 TaxID=1393460 RepID=W0FJZ9_9BACT|nr:transcriptional regulator, PadR family [uncultured bacterium Contig1578]
MDTQLKRGVLDACVLTVLNRGDSYGYQLVRDVEALIEISESTLYPILKRLEAAGQVTVYTVEHSGRLRKYYRITEAGRQRIAGFLEEWQELVTLFGRIQAEALNGYHGTERKDGATT